MKIFFYTRGQSLTKQRSVVSLNEEEDSLLAPSLSQSTISTRCQNFLHHHQPCSSSCWPHWWWWSCWLAPATICRTSPGTCLARNLYTDQKYFNIYLKQGLSQILHLLEVHLVVEGEGQAGQDLDQTFVWKLSGEDRISLQTAMKRLSWTVVVLLSRMLASFLLGS